MREVGLFGISLELDLKPAEVSSLAQDFVPSLRRLCSQLAEERRAILVILDDINGLAHSGAFANWLKSTVDEVATAGKSIPVCLLLVGLEDVRQALVESQPSLARVFELVDIAPWDEGETRQFFARAFDSVSVEVEPEALDTMARYTGGLPVLGHEIGDAVYRRLAVPRATDMDALAGVAVAADVVGHKLLEPQVLSAIRSEHYRSILRKLAASPFEFSFRRADVRKKLSPDEQRVLDNFLNRMKRLQVIVSDTDAGPGAYRFGNRLHYLYFSLEAARRYCQMLLTRMARPSGSSLTRPP